ncbi:MAG TPA: protein rep [Polyangiaceae bacterium]|nr:protein rep [Polyangiaceae bacterium]
MGQRPARDGSAVAFFPRYLWNNSTDTPEVRAVTANETWLRRMGELTAAHRAAKAAKFMRGASRRLWADRFAGYSDIYAKASGAWYRSRARGQSERIDRVLECGAETLEITCPGCGQKHGRRTGCRVRLLCVSCRGFDAARTRAVFLRARKVVITVAQSRGLLNGWKRWSEKFLTLTTPHFPNQSIPERIECVLQAWKRFLRRLNKHWREHGVTSAEVFRVLEWTIGNDRLGHPHLHVWLFCPYIEQAELKSWWGQALAEVTGEPTALRAIVDIREAKGGFERELIKYLTKDIMADGSKVPPELYAEVYKALDGHRNTQASRGFMGKGKQVASRCECGTDPPKHVRRVKAPASQKEATT